MIRKLEYLLTLGLLCKLSFTSSGRLSQVLSRNQLHYYLGQWIVLTRIVRHACVYTTHMEGAKECGEGGHSGSCSKGIHGYAPFKDNSELKLSCCVKACKFDLSHLSPKLNSPAKQDQSSGHSSCGSLIRWPSFRRSCMKHTRPLDETDWNMWLSSVPLLKAFLRRSGTASFAGLFVLY